VPVSSDSVPACARSVATAVVPAAVLLFAVLWAPAAWAATPVGSVARVQGECTGTVDGATRRLTAEAPVHLAEELATGAGARLAVALDDGTVLTLGENARLTIDEFVFDPAGKSSLAAVVSGAFNYVSGALNAAARQAAVTTPVAVIAVRGTNFWGGPIDGGFGVALFEGSISVTSGGVTTVLDAPGSGVNLAPEGGPSGPVSIWPEEKVRRALATVEFE
jgi:hypothetical protein